MHRRVYSRPADAPAAIDSPISLKKEHVEEVQNQLTGMEAVMIPDWPPQSRRPRHTSKNIGSGDRSSFGAPTRTLECISFFLRPSKAPAILAMRIPQRRVRTGKGESKSSNAAKIECDKEQTKEDGPQHSRSRSLTGRKSHAADADFVSVTAELGRDIFSSHNIKTRCTRSRVCWILCALVLVGMLFSLLGDDSIADPGADFVKVSGLQFSKDCRPFFVAGFNTHDALTAAMLTPSEYKVAGGKSGKDQIRDMFSQAASAGLSVFRMWVHTDDPQFPFQVSAGVYDEASFRALDFVVEEARRNGLKILLCFIDNWKYYNGIDQFVDWSTTAPARTQERPLDQWGDVDNWAGLDPETKKYEVARHALFYNDTDCRKLYKSHISAIIHRKNTFNGRLYRDDPTIFAWDLLNEPRCETWRVPECGRILQKWIEEMSAFVKSIDPNHMVTIGSEGFFKHGSVQEYLNPQDWAGQMGQDFLLNHIPEHIDFATIHVWPDTWDRTEENFEAHWIMSHVDTATFRLGKPVLVEEFGKKLEPHRHHPSSIRVLRDPVFKSTYSVVETAIAESRGIGGTMYWRWDLPMFLGSGRGEYGVTPGDSTFDFVSQHATFINQWISSQPPEPECELGCWIPHKSWYSRHCADLPEVCSAYWHVASKATNATKVTRELQEMSILVGGRLISMDGLQVYHSKAACCRPGLGAFNQGCSWTSWVWS